MSTGNVYQLEREDTLEAQLSVEVRAMLGRTRRTQTQLAAVLGLTQAAVSARLRGDTEWKVSELGLMADWFGVSPSYLLGSGRPRQDSNLQPTDIPDETTVEALIIPFPPRNVQS